MNNRLRMRDTNKKVRFWLLENGYDDIWFKPHSKRNDYVFTQERTYLATDLWNLFDGICFDSLGRPIFLQMKTNAWPKEKPIKDFIRKRMIRVLVLNNTNKMKSTNGKYGIFTRSYP